MANEQLLSYAGVTAPIWTFVGLAVLLSVGRYWIRHVLVGSFRADDLTHFLGLITMIISISLNQMFIVLTVESEAADMAARDSMSRYILQIDFASMTLYIISAWLIKVNFLILFKELFWVQRYFRVLWTVVAVYTALSFVAEILLSLWQCGNPRNLLSPAACRSSSAVSYGLMHINAGLALHWSAELLLFLLPIIPVCNLVVDRSEKIALLATFSTGLLDLMLGVVRACRLNIFKTRNVLTVDMVIGVVELCVVVMLSTVVAYRALLSRDKRQQVLRSFACLGRARKRYSSSGGSIEQAA